MSKVLDMIVDAVVSMPWLIAVAAAVIVILLIVIVVMSSRQRDERDDLGDQIASLKSELDAMDKEQRDIQKKIKEDAAAMVQAQENFDSQLKAKADEAASQLQAKEEETAAQLKAKDEENAAQIREKDEELQAKAEEAAAQLKAKDEENAAQIKAKDEEAAAQLKAKDEELAAMQANIDQWNENRDAIVADARRKADEIVSQAHEAADRILDEASRRLAESEEEVRQNRLVAASSLTDARKRISEMLLTAASELCKGIPANSPIGYAPVYSIDEAEKSGVSAQDMFYEAAVDANEVDEDMFADNDADE